MDVYTFQHWARMLPRILADLHRSVPTNRMGSFNVFIMSKIVHLLIYFKSLCNFFVMKFLLDYWSCCCCCCYVGDIYKAKEACGYNLLFSFQLYYWYCSPSPEKVFCPFFFKILELSGYFYKAFSLQY